MKYYVAYGSNLNVEQMQGRCPVAVPIGTAYLKGYQLRYKGSYSGSYLTIEKNPESVVPVAVWGVTARNEAALDRYEGYPIFYYKKDVILRVAGKTIKAFVYIMREDRPYGIPSKRYVEVCRQGYKDFGLDEYYLEEALNETKKSMSNLSA